MIENNILNLSSNEEDAELVLQQLMGGIQNMPPEQKEVQVEQINQQEQVEQEQEIETELEQTKNVYENATPLINIEDIDKSLEQFILEQEAMYAASTSQEQSEDIQGLDLSAFSEETEPEPFTGAAYAKMFEQMLDENPDLREEINQKVENPTYGQPGAFVDTNGQTQKAKRNNLKLSNETFSAFKNSDAETIRAMVTNEILSKYGGSVHTIVIKSGILIIDGIQPNISLNEVEVAALENCSSWSLAQHIQNNELAPLFHWGVLKRSRCSSFVTTINVDNEEYWYNWMIGDLFTPNRRSNNRRQLMFNLFPYLEVLRIGNSDYSIEKGAIEKIDISNNNRAKAVTKTKGGLFSNYDVRKEAFKANFGFKLHKGTSSMNKWTVDNFKNYATNRGKRGILRFTGGLAARGVIALAATAINLVTQVAYAAFTPVDELETEDNTPTVKETKKSKKSTKTDEIADEE